MGINALRVNGRTPQLPRPMSASALSTSLLRFDFHSNHGHPQSAGLHLPEGACFMSTMRVYTGEFRESAVGLVLSVIRVEVQSPDLITT
jgi:hypothetical protein